MNALTTLATLAVLAAVPVLGGCSKSDSGGSAAAAAAHAVATPEAQTMFKSRCTPCHGDTGHGDGPGAIALNPKPRNYTDATWQKSVTDEQIRKTILYGGAAVGKSPAMPANPDLDGKPELDGLVAVVRNFNGR
jgi:mono/diheme cytochrome c family protein